MVSQMVYNGSKLLQGYTGELSPSFQLRVERCFQVVVVTVSALKRLSNLLVGSSTREVMYLVNADSQSIQGGDQACSFLAGRPIVVLCWGLELSSECGQ
jgi:hypothetical protein